VTWFYVEDNLAFHPKTIAAGNAAMGLWVRAGSWSGWQLTDGAVPTEMARSMGTPGQAKSLVAAGLWTPSADGYQFHQWEERQRTRDEVEEKRRINRERLAKWREQHGK
jgi:hypothetical protein